MLRRQYLAARTNGQAGCQYPGGRNYGSLVNFWSELLTAALKDLCEAKPVPSEMSAHKYITVRSSVPSDLARRADAVTPVLLASSRSDDLERIPALLPHRQWMLIKVTSWSHVVQVVSAVILPIVLCDREIPGLEWPQGLGQLSGAFRRPALILLSDLAADRLWQDVIRYGTFDMLFRPLSQDRLIAALDTARIEWDLRADRTAGANFR